jgi:hypothetical protein
LACRSRFLARIHQAGWTGYLKCLGTLDGHAESHDRAGAVVTSLSLWTSRENSPCEP